MDRADRRTPDALLRAARSGDQRALERLLSDRVDPVVALCRRLVGPAEAEDLAQEALIAIVRGLPGFDGRSAFSSWVYRVTVNVCFDELRRRRRQVEVDAGADAALLPASDPTGSPDGVAGRLDLDAALARLHPGFRAAVVLRDLCDLDYAEIGRILDLPPGTVRSRIKRGRAALVPLVDPGNRAAAAVVPPVGSPTREVGRTATDATPDA